MADDMPKVERRDFHCGSRDASKRSVSRTIVLETLLFDALDASPPQNLSNLNHLQACVQALDLSAAARSLGCRLPPPLHVGLLGLRSRVCRRRGARGRCNNIPTVAAQTYIVAFPY